MPDTIHPSDLDARNGTQDYIMTSSRSETTLLIEFWSLNTQGQDYILHVSIDEIADYVEKNYDNTVSFTKIPVAKDYRDSIALMEA